jgi:hypothetical protein
MASKIINSQTEVDSKTMLEMLMSSWFTRTRSTREMVIGTKNKSAVLTAFSMINYMEQVFECCLLECLNLPWLAVSPDGAAVLNVSAGQVIATVEVKTRVLADRIASAEQVAAKYAEDSGPILCTVGDDVWKEVVDKDHSMQIMVQLSVLKFKCCIYIVGQAGVRGAMGCIIYVVIGKLQLYVLLQFVDKMRDTFEDILNPFFTSGTLDEMVKLLTDG